MTEQKNGLSKLCLAGFILSISPVLLLPLCLMFGYTVLYAFLVLPLIGFIVSIIGLVSAKKKGKTGGVFGIWGIVFPSIGAVLLAVFFLILYMAGSGNRAMAKGEMYSMGRVSEVTNADYDVSEYRIPKGYDFNSLGITVSEADLKTYAGSKLETISSESDLSVKGTYNKYDFLIVRSDRFYDWFLNNNHQGPPYSFGDDYVYHGELGKEWMIEMAPLAIYKDPSDKFIIITNCNDYKVITEFFA